MKNLNETTTAENQKLNSQINASATKNNWFSADGEKKEFSNELQTIEKVDLPNQLSKYYTEYSLTGFDDIYRAKVGLNIAISDVFNIYRGDERKEGCIWLGSLEKSLNAHILAKDERIMLIVYNEHTLGFVFPYLPNNCQILHASILRGATKTDGSVYINPSDKVRLASEMDFENFRCHFGSFGNEKEYIYQK
ncbi:hypothetical protein [Sphingobacterium faecium]|uniref:hypothetical protein n=1 Tax=Sphingobacterium faecium TaxID=34087 RepID=UPI00246973EC|nr:hypothetical protein [Sphingobacterium faecium]MDH5828869.1 hypothetical protein [Sphingobacterium faecium]WGQ17066.1 hypothetical protein QG727_22740 [Sphingobacterium faecium]